MSRLEKGVFVGFDLQPSSLRELNQFFSEYDHLLQQGDLTLVRELPKILGSRWQENDEPFACMLASRVAVTIDLMRYTQGRLYALAAVLNPAEAQTCIQLAALSGFAVVMRPVGQAYDVSIFDSWAESEIAGLTAVLDGD